MMTKRQSWIEKLTPEEREAHMQKMRAGRKAAQEDKVVGELIEPIEEPRTENDTLGDLDDIKWHGLSEPFLRWSIGLLDRARMTCAEALNAAVSRRTAEMCGNPNCKNRIPLNGRHAGELSYHDPETNSVRTLRACSPGCYPAVQSLGRQRDLKALEERHGKVSHQ